MNYTVTDDEARMLKIALVHRALTFADGPYECDEALMHAYTNLCGKLTEQELTQ